MLLDVALHLRAHKPARIVGIILPGEDARGKDPIEPDFSQRSEETVPGILSLPDVQVLMDASGRAGRIKDVAQGRRRLVIERISDMDMREDISAFPKHRLCVVAEIEGVRRAIE